MSTTRDSRVTATIVKGGEYMSLYSDGSIGRPKINMPPSGDWLITGAVTLNNFGGVTRRYTLAENGKQKTHVTDLDHGTQRLWASPDHYIY